MGLIRILLIADTHLGFDLPFRPRINRRRRGPDFFANFERALMPALQGDVHAVVHGGDVLYRNTFQDSCIRQFIHQHRHRIK
jgi:DNA repair exonuclease SbcCD nuclease subunit